MSSEEVEDRKVQAKYFQNTFNLSLPEQVKEIKIKDHFIRDSWILFIRFSYDNKFHDEILNENFTLSIDSISQTVLDDAKRNVFKSFASKPNWFLVPSRATKIYYGKAEHLSPGNWSIMSEAYWVGNDNYCYYLASATHY